MPTRYHLFFFQAEDGIRDRNVTGVQTCALPIFESGTPASTPKPISSPVQNMGHLLHGTSLAFPSQQLRYGFLTMRGSTGGVSREASVPGRQSSRAAEATVSSLI